MPLLRIQRRSTPGEGERLVVRELPKDVHGTHGDDPGEVPGADAQGAGSADIGGKDHGSGPGPENADQSQNRGVPVETPRNTGQSRVVVPSCYRPDALTYIVEGLLAKKTLAEICAEEDMPTVGVVRRWLASDPEFRQAYVEAQRVLALTATGEMLDIADNGEDVPRDRLRIATRKTVAERLCPDVFAPPRTDSAGKYGAGRDR